MMLGDSFDKYDIPYVLDLLDQFIKNDVPEPISNSGYKFELYAAVSDIRRLLSVNDFIKFEEV